MSNINVALSTNTIKDRLRVLASDLANENRHTDAMLIEIAIQTIDGGAPITIMSESIINIIRAALRNGNLDREVSYLVARLARDGLIRGAA